MAENNNGLAWLTTTKLSGKVRKNVNKPIDPKSPFVRSNSPTNDPIVSPKGGRRTRSIRKSRKGSKKTHKGSKRH